MIKPPLISITMGDPAGIGPELIAKSFIKNHRLFQTNTPVILGNHDVLKHYLNKFHKSKKNIVNPISSINEARKNKLNIINVEGNIQGKVIPGKINPLYGKAALEYINRAVKLVKIHNLRALVTAPVSKESIISAGINFSGHTEYLSRFSCSKKTAMLLVSDKYRVVITTRHVPLKNVSRRLSAGLVLEQVFLALSMLKKHFHISSPEILMCSLNPHKGEGGKIGNEEKRIIIPAINILKKKGHGVKGPVSAEDAFNPVSRNITRTLIVTHYHDQAMVPLRLLCRQKLVNVTCGLPFIRTSPAHGVAFDIAGKNIADTASMTEAIMLAGKLSSSS